MAISSIIIDRIGPPGPIGPPGTSVPAGPNIVLSSISVGADFTFQYTDFARYIDANDTGIIATLPPATGSGRLFLAVKIDSSVNEVTIAADGTDLIDGSASVVIVDQYSDYLLQDASMGYWHAILAT